MERNRVLRKLCRLAAPACLAAVLLAAMPVTGAAGDEVTLDWIFKKKELGIRDHFSYKPGSISWSEKGHLLAFLQKTDEHGRILVVMEPGKPDGRIALTGAQVEAALEGLAGAGEKGVSLGSPPDYGELTVFAPLKPEGDSGDEEPEGHSGEDEEDETPSMPGFSWLKKRPQVRFTFDDQRLVYDPIEYRLFRDPQPEMPEGDKENLERSPDGRYAAYTQAGDLFVFDFENGKEVRLTETGSDTILNGKFPWVYWEEMMWRTTWRAFHWKPQGDAIAYLQFDEEGVSEYPITDFSTKVPSTRMQRYPKVGTRNPSVRLGIVSLSSRETRWIDLGEPHEYLIYVTWKPDGSALSVQTLNRRQDHLRLYEVPVGETRARAILEEKSDTWVEPMDFPRYLEESDGFVWPSARSGYRHLYYYQEGAGKVAQLTRGSWEVEHPGFLGRSIFLAEKSRRVYYMSAQDSPLERQLYWVSLDGGRPHRMTREPGWHTLNFSADGAYTVDSWSSYDVPSRVDLLDRDGKLVTTLFGIMPEDLAPYRYSRPEIHEVKGKDGTLFYGALLKPLDFDPARKYPVVSYVYGEPAGQVVVNSWMSSVQQVLLNRGFLVWRFDGRGTPGRGRPFLDPTHKNQTRVPVEDWKEGIAYLESLPYVDGGRLGVYGASGGGTMTLNLMLRSPGLFEAGAAIAAVIDKKLYDTIYTERYLGPLDENQEGYEASSPLFAAEKLEGKLLVMHGISDDNVHVQNVYNFLDALTAAEKDYRLYLYPPAGHGGNSNAVGYHQMKSVIDFFVESLRP